MNKELLELWRYRPPSHRDFHQLEEIFPSASYQYVLYGMGFRPQAGGHARRLDDRLAAERCIRATAQLTAKYLKAFHPIAN